MKKSLVALAVLAASGAAMAQSSVTLFGVVDTNLQLGRGSVSDVNRIGNSGISSTQLGFRGTEDLGGGLAASFWLELGINSDDGSGQANNTNNQAGGAIANGGGLQVNRRSTVSLTGGFGELRLGRDYTPQFRNITMYDPFGTNGVGTTQLLGGTNGINGGLTNVRASNSVGYLGSFSGVSVEAKLWLGENASTTGNAGDGGGIRVGYDAGPLSLGLAYASTQVPVGASTGSLTNYNFGGGYDFGFLRLLGMYNYADLDGGATGKGWQLGLTAPVGPGVIRASYASFKSDAGAEPKSNKLSVGYVYNLSKRTALYTTFARISNSGGATQALNGSVTAANANSTGYDFGIRHSF